MFSHQFLASAEKSFATLDGASTIVVNLRGIIELVATSRSQLRVKDESPDLSKPLPTNPTVATDFDDIRPLLALLLTQGLDPSIDAICSDQLSLRSSSTSFGISWSVLSISSSSAYRV